MGLPVEVVAGLLDAAAAEQDTDLTHLLADLEPADAARVTAGVRRLRATSDRLRRRGQELAALFSSARELAQLRDVDELLARLVERAHDLVGTDVTYLSEFDVGSRELRVRTTLGTVAPTFPGLRVPAGMGLASQVVESRRPCWTARYSAMTQAPHDQGIDETVAAEGLISLLGVPLLAGDEVIGVLFAANRVEHAFSPEEISLLSAFADHAAVVLQTARLLARANAAADETRRAYGELARHVEAMERASEVHGDLTALVLQGGDAADVASALGRALRCRVTLLDTARLDGAVREAVEQSRRSGRCVAAGAGAFAVAVLAGPALLGALLLEQGTVEFGPVEIRTAERAAQITALLSLKQDAMIEAEQRVRGDLLADLLSTDQDRRDGAGARARARGIRLDELHSVVVAAVPAELRRDAVRALRRAGGLVGEHADRVVMLTGEEDPAAAARAVHADLNRALAAPVLTVGAAREADLRDQAEAAGACARILPALGVTDAAVTTDEYLPYTALFGPGEARVARFVRSVVGPVLDWDAEHAGTLLPTLAAYLDHRMSPVNTARALHLHKNTVLQRLDRIGELLGEGWQNPDRLFRVTVAVRLARLADSP
ncbi:GAF domain-containing protein [Amycolatopsis endophytica]|uniref:GAF domain-containing protein n=1 Tax=Amycolatopsis endophytica TaxID=860233 RepID=A0A853B7U1_9PSEU|nr:helix-turn-helix domain-containing protein [Amycolatopsis endophytica]NYI90855.1 GAF domain-containing protein [Amycolatopsis endophytica]